MVKRSFPVIFLVFLLPTLTPARGDRCGADRDEGADSQSGKIRGYELLKTGIKRTKVEIIPGTFENEKGELFRMVCGLLRMNHRKGQLLCERN